MINVISPRNSKNNTLLNNSDYQSRANMFIQRTKISIKDYVQRIRNYTQVRSIKSLSQDQLFAINDQSSKYYTQYHKKQEISEFEQQYFQYKEHKFTLFNLIKKLLKSKPKPNFRSLKATNPLIIILNFVKILVIVHIFFLIPLLDSFGQEINEFIDVQYPLFIIEWIILIIDVFLKFNIQIYDKGVLLTQRRSIIKKYLRKGFLLNFLGLISFSIMLFIPTNHFKYLFYLKCKELSRFWKFVKEELDPQLRFKTHLELLKLLFIVIILAHFFACVWIATGKHSGSNNWIETRGISNCHWMEIYLNGLYFSVTTMTTVGFGDITATNIYEVGVAICLILFSSCIFAFVFNTITQILSDLDQNQSKFKHDLQLIKNYMNKRGIDKGLQVKAQKYLRQIHKYGPSNSEQKVLKKLSPQLQSELNEQDKGGLLLKQPFLVNNFSFKFLRDLTGKVQEINLEPNEKFDCQPGFYIIYKGEFQAQTTKDVRVIGNLKPGDICGLKSLFNIGYKNIQIMSKTFSILYHVAQEDFMQIMPEIDFEQYQQIFDKIQFNVFDNLHEKCMLCQKKGHEICSEILYIPNKELIIAKYLFSADQLRMQFQRRLKKSHTFHRFLSVKRVAFSCAIKIMKNQIQMNSISEQSESDDDQQINPPDSYDEIEQNPLFMDENKKQIHCKYIQQLVIKRQSVRGPSIFQLIQGFNLQKIPEDDQFSIISDFDRKQIYQMYFPSYNYDIIFRKINKIRKNKHRLLNQLFNPY